jgi:hypothetical protein
MANVHFTSRVDENALRRMDLLIPYVSSEEIKPPIHPEDGDRAKVHRVALDLALLILERRALVEGFLDPDELINKSCHKRTT